MSAEPQQQRVADHNTWPVVECESTDVFHSEFIHDCTPHLSEEQKTWPVVECEPTDVFHEPMLVLDLTVRGGAELGDVALSMAELLAALNAREEALGGSGLVYDPRKSRRDKDRVRVVLYPKKESGAQSRLRELAKLIEQVGNLVIPVTAVGEKGSFVECHAVVAAESETRCAAASPPRPARASDKRSPIRACVLAAATEAGRKTHAEVSQPRID